MTSPQPTDTGTMPNYAPRLRIAYLTANKFA